MTQGIPVIRDYKYDVPGKGRICYFEDLNDARRRILQDLNLPPTASFLDVGTGDGWFALEAHRLLPGGLTATIELGWDDVDDVSRSYIVDPRRIHFLRMDAYRQGFKDNAFDVAGSFLAVQDISFSLDELTRLTVETARVVKPGGAIIIVTITPEDAETEGQRLGIEMYRYIRAGYFSQAQVLAAIHAAHLDPEPVRFYATGVNLNLEAALRFVKFQTGFWKQYYQLETPDWTDVWERFRSRIEAAGGLEVEAKLTVFVARK